MKKAVFPGNFDPLTNGHLDIILRSYFLFDQFFIAIFDNPNKKCTFSIQKRKTMIQELVNDLNLSHTIIVQDFSELLVHFLNKIHVQVIIRGIRTLADFDFEFRTSRMNYHLNPQIQTFFLLSKPEYEHISSSLIKEVFKLGGNVSPYLPKNILNYLKQLSNHSD